MKQAESAAHSSGRNGGARRVLDAPARGVLQKMPIATDRTSPPCLSAGRDALSRRPRAVPTVTMNGLVCFVTSQCAGAASRRLHDFVGIFSAVRRGSALSPND